MKKSTKIVIAALILIILAVVAIVVVKSIKTKNANADVENESSNSLSITTAEDMGNLIDKLYVGLEDKLPNSLTSSELDISNPELVKTYTGLDNIEGIESIVVSEPMMSSQAYSLILVKADTSKRADEIAKLMNENVNTNKWICVTAEKVYSTSSGNIAFLIMSSEEWAKPVYENFKKEAGQIGTEYERTENM